MSAANGNGGDFSSGGISQALIDEVTIRDTFFKLRVIDGRDVESEYKASLKGARGLERLSHEKAIEWVCRMQIEMDEGKSLNDAMDSTFDQVYAKEDLMKLMVPGLKLLRDYWVHYTQEIDSFVGTKKTDYLNGLPMREYDPKCKYTGGQGF